jgi:hypothetical protein
MRTQIIEILRMKSREEITDLMAGGGNMAGLVAEIEGT